MSDKATARPWRLEDDPIAIEILGPHPSYPVATARGATGGTYVSKMNEATANARLIVMAVNAYEAHQRAAQALRKLMEWDFSRLLPNHPDFAQVMADVAEGEAALAELDKVMTR